MDPNKWRGIDDTDDLTIGKIVGEGGTPVEHKRELAEYRKRHERVAEYEKSLKERQKQHGFIAEEKAS